MDLPNLWLWSGLRIGPQLMDGLSAGCSPPRSKEEEEEAMCDCLIAIHYQLDDSYYSAQKPILILPLIIVTCCTKYLTNTISSFLYLPTHESYVCDRYCCVSMVAVLFT